MWVEPKFWEYERITAACDIYSAGLTALAVLFGIMPPELGELKDEWREDPAAVVAGIMRRQAFAEWRADTVSSLLEICMRC